MIKSLQKTGIEAMTTNPQQTISLNGEKVKALPLRLGTRQGCPRSPLLFSIGLEVLTMAVTEVKERNPNWKRSKKKC